METTGIRSVDMDLQLAIAAAETGGLSMFIASVPSSIQVLYLRLIDLVNGATMYLDAVFDDALMVQIMSDEWGFRVHVVIHGNKDEPSTKEYLFFEHGNVALRNPSDPSLPNKGFIDWESGIRHLLRSLDEIRGYAEC
jgi:hypothetical protein